MGLTKLERTEVQAKKDLLTESIFSKNKYKIFEVDDDSEELDAMLSFASPTLYILKCQQYYKIGYTYNPLKSRMEDMKTSNPFPIELCMAFRVEKCEEVEKLLHTSFAHRRSRGEWFGLTLDDIHIIEKSFLLHWKNKQHGNNQTKEVS